MRFRLPGYNMCAKIADARVHCTLAHAAVLVGCRLFKPYVAGQVHHLWPLLLLLAGQVHQLWPLLLLLAGQVHHMWPLLLRHLRHLLVLRQSLHGTPRR